MDYLWIALGSAAGGVSRALVVNWLAQRLALAPIWSTVAVNVTGSLAIGFLTAWVGRPAEDGHPVRAVAGPLLMTGFCGGYTTFSAFSLHTLQLAQSQRWWQAGANIVLSLVLCLLAVGLGWLAGSAGRR
ncbi:MAG TPA: CrcB family protein [Methylomirabilota bacterium]|nr:CrcB family protein [Methylomirabilota bacterium]